MKFDRIDRLVTKEEFCFQAWDDRYCKGVWAALGLYESQVDTVRDLSSTGDLDMIPAMDYVFSANWLPYVTGRTLLEAMDALEQRLASLPADQLRRSSDWSTLVSNAIEALAEACHNSTGYGDLERNIPPDLPETFEEAMARIITIDGSLSC